MRTHGIGGLQSTPKKEPKEGGSSSTPSKAGRSTKKRKLEEIDDEAGDIDEPIKGEVKHEVKSEIASHVKAELGLGSLASLPSVLEHRASQATPDDDDDDDVQIVSATERHPDPYASERAHSHSPASHMAMPGLSTFDYATNMFSPHQMTATMARPSLPRLGHGHPTPYGFPANPTWYHPQQHHGSTSGYYWPSIAVPSSEGHQHEEHHNA